MRETKTKKALFALFLIPLASLLSLFFGTVATNTATYAANCAATKYAYSLSDDGKTITEKVTGETEVNPGTSFSSCTSANATNTYTEKDSSLVYSKRINDNCGNTITLSSAPKAGSNNISGNYQPYTTNCTATVGARTVSVAIGSGYSGTAGTSTDGTNGGDTQKTTSCSIDGIGWLLCPVIDFGSNIADSALSFLSTTFLETNTDLYSTDSPTYSAWQWILGFANIIFVIIFLIIIFSQATGFGISNYGIKKMLPKLIIGVVLINVSYFICQILIDASNLTGYGFNKFFDTLANGIQTSNTDDPTATGTVFGGIATVILTAVGVGLAVDAALTAFIPVLIAALVGLLMIFLLLVARQALIIMAIIIAPLAFAAWLLPNTEKLFKRWWSIFIQLLLLFPIVGLVYGSSKVVSKIIAKVYSGDGTSSISGGLANASSIHGSNGGNLIGQIIAAAVLVVPLFAVPFLLKGAINGIPVLGKLAQKTYGNATGGARKRTQGITDPMFAGLKAQRQAGVRGFMGRNRVQRDAQGTPIVDDKGRLVGKNGQPVRRTASQWINETKKSFDDNEKSFNALGDAQYANRIANEPTSLAGKAKRRSETAELLSGRAHDSLGAELDREKLDTTSTVGRLQAQREEFSDISSDASKERTNVWNQARANANSPEAQSLRAAGVDTNGLVNRNIRGRALDQSSTNAEGIQRTNYGAALDPKNAQFDQSVLDIAGGSVDTNGQLKAQAYGIQAIREAQSKNVQANMVYVNDQVRRSTADYTARGEVKADGRPYGDLDFLSRQFDDAVEAKDTDRLRAVSTLMLRQGSRGYDVLDASLQKEKNNKILLDNVEMSRDYRGYMVDEHAKDLKVRHRDTLQFMFEGKMINPEILKMKPTDPGYTKEVKDAIEKVRGFYAGLTPEETASQTVESSNRGVDSGGIDLTSAQSILLEDGLVQKMTTPQIGAITRAVELAKQDPARAEAAVKTAKIIKDSVTFPRFDASIKARILKAADLPFNPNDIGGEPGPGPSSTGNPDEGDESVYSGDDPGGVGGDDD